MGILHPTRGGSEIGWGGPRSEGALNRPAKGIQHINLFDRDSNRFCSNPQTFAKLLREPRLSADKTDNFGLIAISSFRLPVTASPVLRPVVPGVNGSTGGQVDRCRGFDPDRPW